MILSNKKGGIMKDTVETILYGLVLFFWMALAMGIIHI